MTTTEAELPLDQKLADAVRDAAVIEDPSEWRTMKRAFELATRHRTTARPPVIACIETELALLALAQLGSANELHEALQTWLNTTPSGASAFDSELHTRWKLLNELRELTAGVPKKVWVAITRAILDGSAHFAVAEVAEFKRTKPVDAAQAYTWWKGLAVLGPQLQLLYDQIPLKEKAPSPPPKPDSKKEAEPPPPQSSSTTPPKPAPPRQQPEASSSIQGPWSREQLQFGAIVLMGIVIVFLLIFMMMGPSKS